MEFRLRTLGGELYDIHLIQLFLTGHGHVAGGDARFIACHKILELADFLLLLLVGSLKLGFLHFVDFLEIVIISDVAVQFLIFHMINDVHHFIQKRNVMGNQDERIFIFGEITFQSVDMLFVQIVGWLVQKQDVRLFQKEFAEQDTGALAAA